MYRYLNICGDPAYRTSIEAQDAVRVVEAGVPWVRRAPAFFTYDQEDGWFLVSLLNCDGQGGFSSNGQLPDRVNLIEVVAGSRPQRALEIAAVLAVRLGWLVLEVTLD